MNFFELLNYGVLSTYVPAVDTNPIGLLLSVVFVIALGYLLGSVNTAIIVSRLFYHDDVRKHGSGNAGLTNVFRTYGKKAALWTLFGDVLKTVLAIVISGVLFGFEYVGVISISARCYIAATFAVLGHCFPLYYHMKGGKGVLVSATAVLVLSPIVFAILFLIFVAVVAASKYVSLGSVSAVVLYPVLLKAYFNVRFGTAVPFFPALCSIILAVLVVFRHMENLKRIGNRTERKFSFKKENGDE